MHTELRRLFGGENPELLDRIDPLLQKFSTELDTRVGARVADLFTTAVRQFDLDDPTSPMAKHAAGLERNQAQLADHLERRHAELAEKFDDLTRELQLRTAEKRATSRSPKKGDLYADDLHTLLTELATGLGDEYTDTSSRTGAVARSKKGDGLLVVAGCAARVVVEMTDSPRTSWNDYLDEAERNHCAAASLGLVRNREHNADRMIRVLGPRRIVLAFDPDSDDPDLLRTVLMLLRTAALAATARADIEHITTAEENINRALDELTGIDDIKKTASGIYKNAQKIENQCNTIRTGIERTLTAALTALTIADPTDAAA